MEYVAGLLYNDEGTEVALILKNRPAWQAGQFNAIGGKIELDETPEMAMRREFIEEAGVDIQWDFRTCLTNPGIFTVYFFSCHSTMALENVVTMTDEPIEICQTYGLPENTVANLWWIIPMLNDGTVVVPQVIQDIQGY